MNIYIDESGGFLPPQHASRALSCVGALVIPERSRDAVFARYHSLVSSWPATVEVKGSTLGEAQMAAVIALLIEFRCLFLVCATEMSANDPAELQRYQQLQARYLTEDLTGRHSTEVRNEAWVLRRILEAMPPQLFL